MIRGGEVPNLRVLLQIPIVKRNEIPSPYACRQLRAMMIGRSIRDAMMHEALLVGLPGLPAIHQLPYSWIIQPPAAVE
jgi:hypothetical protein